MRFIVLGLYSVIGLVILVPLPYQPSPAISWMNIYRFDDFSSIGDMVRFMGELRVPIPPHLAALEISTALLTNNPPVGLVTLIYQVSLFGAYFLVLVMVPFSRLPWAFLLTIIFLENTTIVHPGNPQLHDVLFPFLILAFFVTIRGASKQTSLRMMMLACFTAGFTLSMLELTRAFVFYVLPVLLAFSYMSLRHLPRRALLTFLAPIILFSGTWHVHLLLSHGQVIASNHTGFNLHRAWAMVPQPEFIPADNAPLGPDRWENLNNPQHIVNSRRLQSAIVEFALQRPVGSTSHIINRISELLEPQTGVYDYQPSDWLFGLYRLAVRIASGLLIINLLLLFVELVKRPRHSFKLLTLPENTLILLASFTVFVLAVGESGEEARLVITVLPLFALLPMVEQVHTVEGDGAIVAEANNEVAQQNVQ